MDTEGLELTDIWEHLTTATGEIAELLHRRASETSPPCSDEIRRHLAAARAASGKATLQLSQLLANRKP